MNNEVFGKIQFLSDFIVLNMFKTEASCGADIFRGKMCYENREVNDFESMKVSVILDYLFRLYIKCNLI